jgi:hypothetical protein
MAAAAASVILEVWERGLRQPLQRQAVALLAAVTPGAAEAEMAGLPLGARDSLLFDLRERLFGPELSTLATCPACGERLEARFDISDVRAAAEAPAEGALLVEIGGHSIAMRPPATVDLFAIPEGSDAAAAHALLLDRCVVEARDAAGSPVDRNALPPEALSAIAQALAKADPQALVDIELPCEGCGVPFKAIFDIASFLMREIHAWAQQILHEVDLLARTYGWSESEILALSPVRRAFYLGMAAR